MRYEDIKAGDTISYTEGGITYSGVAHHMDRWGDWLTEEDEEIGWHYRSSEGDNAFVLVNRPTPEQPENLGAVVSASAYGKQAEEFVRVVSGPNGWYDNCGSQYEWAELDDVTVLHAGWDGETIG